MRDSLQLHVKTQALGVTRHLHTLLLRIDLPTQHSWNCHRPYFIVEPSCSYKSSTVFFQKKDNSTRTCTPAVAQFLRRARIRVHIINGT